MCVGLSFWLKSGFKSPLGVRLLPDANIAWLCADLRSCAWWWGLCSSRWPLAGYDVMNVSHLSMVSIPSM